MIEDLWKPVKYDKTGRYFNRLIQFFIFFSIDWVKRVFHTAMAKDRVRIQLIWGVALVLAGIGVYFRIPQVLPKIEQIAQFSSVAAYIRFCFYLLGTLLIVGGVKKIIDHYPKS